MDVGRVGVGRINLDASRDRIGRAEEEVVLRDRKFRVPQPGDADVRVHQRLPDRVDIVGRLGGRVGQKLRFYTGPQHRVGGAVDELVRRPVGLGVVPGVPVVGVVDVDLPPQRRRGVDAQLPKQPVKCVAIVRVQPLAGAEIPRVHLHRLAEATDEVGRTHRWLDVLLECQELLHVGEAAWIIRAWPRGSHRVSSQAVLTVQHRRVVQHKRPVGVVVHHVEPKPRRLVERQAKRWHHAGQALWHVVARHPVSTGAVVTVQQNIPGVGE